MKNDFSDINDKLLVRLNKLIILNATILYDIQYYNINILKYYNFNYDKLIILNTII